MDPHRHPRLLEWWRDDPADPGRRTLGDPAVQRLATEIAPGSPVTDLGGVMSLNAHLASAGLVLRVHQPFVSRRRLLAVQEVRRRLAALGLVVPTPVAWRASTVFRCGNRWAELEEFIPHVRAEPTLDSYRWMFSAMGRLHRALATLDVAVPRPLVATYATPTSLRRWMPVTQSAVQGDPEAVEIANLLHDLIRRLRAQWVPASRLPMHLVHGDVRLRNVCRTPDGEIIYLDFGFLAHRPRIHDLAYSLAFMFLALGDRRAPERFPWHNVPRLVEAYDAAADTRLTASERQTVAPATAAVPLYCASLDGFTDDPPGLLRSRLPFLRLSEWLLAHPDAVLGGRTSC